MSDLQSFKTALINGDNKELKEIYLLFRKDCISFLHKKGVTDPNYAEDHYTDAIIVLRDNIISGKLIELSNIKSYLLGICLNMARNENYIKSRKTKKESVVRLLLYDNNHDKVEDSKIKAERIKVCRTALNTLSTRCQKILILYYVHNLKMKEIADELNLSSGDVAKTLKSRCYKSWIEACKKIST